MLHQQVWSDILSQVRRKKRLLKQYGIVCHMSYGHNWTLAGNRWVGWRRVSTIGVYKDMGILLRVIGSSPHTGHSGHNAYYKVHLRDQPKVLDIMAALCLYGAWCPKITYGGDYRLITLDEGGLFVEGKPQD